MSQIEKNRPLISFGVGGYSVALWDNPVDAGDGTQRMMRSVSLRRGYFNKKEGKLVEQKITINPAEVGCVVALLEQMEQAMLTTGRTRGTGDDAESTDDIPF